MCRISFRLGFHLLHLRFNERPQVCILRFVFRDWNNNATTYFMPSRIVGESPDALIEFCGKGGVGGIIL